MKRLSLALVLLCVGAVAVAGNQFVARNPVFSDLVKTSRQVQNVALADLFAFPDGMEPSSDLTREGSGVGVQFDFGGSVGALSLYQLAYNAQSQQTVASIYVEPNRAGSFSARVLLTYRGQTVESLLRIERHLAFAQDDRQDVCPGQTVTLDVLANDQFCQSSLRRQVALSLESVTQWPRHGTLALTQSASGTAAFSYASRADTPPYSSDTLAFCYQVAHLDTVESVCQRVVLSLHASAYATRVYGFQPAPGQFTNTPDWAMADPAQQQAHICGAEATGLCLGSFGGYVVLGFDQPIVDRPEHPYGVDFSIRGNAFSGTSYGVWSEPAAVQVMKDVNGDGLPNDGPWYELAGSDYWLSTTRRHVGVTYRNPGYNASHDVAYHTTGGQAGAVVPNPYHTQPYYPDPYAFGCPEDSLCLWGNAIRSTIDKRSTNYIMGYRSLAFGYADNHPSANADLTRPTNPYFADENGPVGDGFDLAWAVDSLGNHVDLDTVHFVRIYTAGMDNMGQLGEWSSEVLGVALTTPDPAYQPRDLYINYIGAPQLLLQRGEAVAFRGMAFRNGRPVEGQGHWWVADPVQDVISVDADGVVTGLSSGVARLCYQQTLLAPADTVDVQVCDVASLVVNQPSQGAQATLRVGEWLFVHVEDVFLTDETMNASKRNRYWYDAYDWRSSDPSVGTVADGLFRALRPGTTTVTATSRLKPQLSVSVTLTVLPLPTVRPLTDYLRVAHNAPAGRFTNGQLFTTGTDATVRLTSVEADHLSADVVSLVGNDLCYRFADRQYQSDSVTVGYSYKGQEGLCRYLIDYQPDVLESEATVARAADFGGQAIVSDGAFVYVATDSMVCRHHVQTRREVARAVLPARVERMAVSADKLLVSLASAPSSPADGVGAVHVLFKTDLSDFLPTAEQCAQAVGVLDTIVPAAEVSIAALSENTAPTEAGTQDFQSAVISEWTTAATLCRLLRNSFFADEQGNATLHLYPHFNPARCPFITSLETVTTATAERVDMRVLYTEPVDSDMVVILPFEAIDDAGLSVVRDYQLRLKPRIYRPVVNPDVLFVLNLGDDQPQALWTIDDIYTYPGTASEQVTLRFDYAIDHLSDPSMLHAEVGADGEGNASIVLTPTEQTVEGEYTVSVTQQVQHKTQSAWHKTFIHTFPVVVKPSHTPGHVARLTAAEGQTSGTLYDLGGRRVAIRQQTSPGLGRIVVGDKRKKTQRWKKVQEKNTISR